MSKNYRDIISQIGAHYTEPGEDWDQNLLAGAPDVVNRACALGIARWMDNEADAEWGADARHHDIARDIRATVRTGKPCWASPKTDAE